LLWVNSFLDPEEFFVSSPVAFHVAETTKGDRPFVAHLAGETGQPPFCVSQMVRVIRRALAD